jgi:REP element-mobilizing transposase RayT
MSYREYYRRHLPHWQPLCATVFVTFRLADSLPQAVIDRLRDEREADLRKAGQMVDAARRRTQEYVDERTAFARWDRALDCCVEGPHCLIKPEIATIIAEALHYRDSKLYDLLAFCIMPNHVHLVCTPLPVGWTTSAGAWRCSANLACAGVGRIGNPAYDGAGETPTPAYEVHSLSSILQSLKGHTARRANAKLGRRGAFWQEESYDHVIRDAEELERVIHYVIDNPVKAGLVESWRDWAWTYSGADCQSGLPIRD